MMGFGMMGGGFFGLLIVGALIYFLVNSTNQHPHNHHRRNDALDLLKERYAKGEISDEEFQRKKSMLER